MDRKECSEPFCHAKAKYALVTLNPSATNRTPRWFCGTHKNVYMRMTIFNRETFKTTPHYEIVDVA